MRGAASAIFLSAVLSAAPAAGQALLPAKGEAFASVLFTNLFVENHFLPARAVDVGHIDSNVVLFDVTYGVHDRLAVTFGIPLVMSRYQGAFPHQPTNPDAPDNSGWNTTFSDFRFNLRYNLVRGPLAVTPYVGTVLPSHAYDFVAHAAPGKRLREVQFGVSTAAVLDRFIPRMFMQGRLGFAVVEESVDIRPNYSSADFELGYFVSPAVRVFGMASGRYTHSGIDLPIPPIARQVLPPDQFLRHDQIVREHYLNLSVGSSVSLSESLDLFGSFTRQVTGRNSHQIDRAISVGLSWAFKRRTEPGFVQEQPDTAAAPQAAARKSLVKCLCQKG